jgi:hypothetical protein
LLLVALLVGLVITLAALIAACGGGNGITTTGPTVTPTTAGQPGETSTTGAQPGEVTTTTETQPGETTTTTAVEETTTTTVPEESTTTTEKLSSAEQRLANGHIKAMGYIKKVWEQGGKRYISIDYAEMLTGDAAVKAAIKAGYIKPGESLDNDYFISNTSKELRQFVVSGSPAITVAFYEGETDKSITWSVFKSIWSANPPSEATFSADDPWWIERDGPTVLKIAQQFLP